MPIFPQFGTDYEHGTAVSSLIVDGASTNPELDDGGHVLELNILELQG